MESSEIEVVVEFGVPLRDLWSQRIEQRANPMSVAYGTSEGVTGSDGGGGRLIRVDAFDIFCESFRDCAVTARILQIDSSRMWLRDMGYSSIETCLETW